MARVEVLLPVRRFDVLVTYHPFDGLTPVEEHLLLAVLAGANSIDVLASHLGLPRRLLLDACVDLLSIGALEIGVAGDLITSDRTRKAIGDWRSPTKGWETVFATRAAPPAEPVALMQETVSGSVFRSIASQREFREGLPRLPQDPELPSVDDIPRAEFLTAVLARPQRAKPVGDVGTAATYLRRARVGDVRLRRSKVLASGVQPSAEVSAYVITVDIRAAHQGGDLPPRFSVLAPDSLPSFVRARIGAGLARLWERGVSRGPDQVFAHIPYESDAVNVANGSRHELADVPVQRLEAALAAIRTPTTSDHDQLLALERDAIGAVMAAIAAGAQAELVEGARAHHEALHTALETADQQVILAGPWVSRFENADVRRLVAKAVERGVTVVLLWGIARDDMLPAAVRSLHDELTGRKLAGSFRVAERSALSHAKLIVCDHNWALVTSCNFLSSSPDRTTSELGVRLMSPPPFADVDPADARVPPSHPISELLRWARVVAPDYRVGRAISDSPILFGLGSEARRIREPPQILPPQPVMPELWRAAWSARIAELREELVKTGAYALPIDSSSHREVLFDAMASSQRRLLIESPEVTAVATSEPFIQALLNARSRGVDVAIRFAKRDPAGPDGDARWMKLAPAGVRLIKADTHAKLLVGDDWLLVSSFNFLSFEGRHRRELGVQVVDRPLADRAAARF